MIFMIYVYRAFFPLQVNALVEFASSEFTLQNKKNVLNASVL